MPKARIAKIRSEAERIIELALITKSELMINLFGDIYAMDLPDEIVMTSLFRAVHKKLLKKDVRQYTAQFMAECYGAYARLRMNEISHLVLKRLEASAIKDIELASRKSTLRPRIMELIYEYKQSGAMKFRERHLRGK